MLYFIGLGLGDAKDITVKGLEIVRRCERVYLEAYTSVLTCGQKELEEFYGRTLILADRDMVEQNSDEILSGSESSDVAFLVVGDPFGATTHSDLLLRAQARKIPTRSVHNASIVSAVGCVGLQLYNFGETVSVPFWTDKWRPESFYYKIATNKERGFHTLCLLDIKVKEQTVENMMRGRKVFEPARFMTTAQAATQLLAIAAQRRSAGQPAPINDDTMTVAVARVGCDDQRIVTATLEDFKHLDMGKPLHSLVIPGQMHPLEMDAVQMHALPY